MDEFCKAFASYIAKETFSIFNPNLVGSETDIINVLLDSSNTALDYMDKDEKSEIFNKLGEHKMKFNGVHFPNIDTFKGEEDFRYIFVKFKSVHFENCTIHYSNTNYHQEVEAIYTNCTFKNRLKVIDGSRYKNFDNSCYVYSDCTFERNVDIRPKGDVEIELPNNQFSNCTICGKLFVKCAVLKGILFARSKRSETLAVNRIVLLESKFSGAAYFNNLKTSHFHCVDCIFSQEFDLSSSIVSNFKVRNSNFEGMASLNESEFGGFLLKNCSFNRLVNFENSEFGSENAGNKKFAQFANTTFLEFISFRGTKFHQGLDLMKTNRGRTPNFLGVDCKPENTNRETFSIIKDSFDKSGNKIEANKFYAMEMNKYRIELNSMEGMIPEKILVNLNMYVSNFGQSYIFPILWIVFFGILSLLNGKCYSMLVCNFSTPDSVSCVVNEFAKGIVPIGRFLTPGKELVSLFFYIIFSTLIWHTIIALKRVTRR